MKINRVFVLGGGLGTSVLQFMTRDIAHGFRRLGLDVYVEQEAYPGIRHDPFRMMKMIHWFRPQLVFRMDHVRAEDGMNIWIRSPDKDGWDGRHVHASWIQDALGFCHFDKDPEGKPIGRHLVKDFGEREVIFTSFPGLAARFRDELGFPGERIHHLPVGANCDLFYPEPLPPDEPFTVGFPCNVGDPATAQDPRRTRRRTDPVRWLLELGVKVKLWGRGWDANDLFRPHWLGDVKNGPDLREAYNSCHAILMANSDTNLHQRAFEAQACGRPVLAYALENDTAPDGILSHGLASVIRFRDKDELARMIESAKAVSGCVELARARAMKHDYPARCRRILDICEPLL